MYVQQNEKHQNVPASLNLHLSSYVQLFISLIAMFNGHVRQWVA